MGFCALRFSHLPSCAHRASAARAPRAERNGTCAAEYHVTKHCFSHLVFVLPLFLLSSSGEDAQWSRKWRLKGRSWPTSLHTEPRWPSVTDGMMMLYVARCLLRSPRRLFFLSDQNVFRDRVHTVVQLRLLAMPCARLKGCSLRFLCVPLRTPPPRAPSGVP